MVLETDPHHITAAPAEFGNALDELGTLEDELASSLEPVAVVQSLLAFAEECAALSIAGKPIEAIAAIRIHKWLHSRYGDLRSFLLPTQTSELAPEVAPLWRCMLARWELQEMKAKLDAGDAILVTRPEGLHLIQNLPSNPTALVDEFTAKAAVGQETSFKLLWTSRMEPVVRWCQRNEYPLDFKRASLDEELFMALRSEQEEDDEKKFHWRQRVSLGFSFYNSVFSALRFAAARDDFLGDILNHYSDLPTHLRDEFGERIDHRLWLSAATRLHAYTEPGLLPVRPKAIEMESHPAWPISSPEGTLMASALLLGLGVRERHDIAAKSYDTGPWFEDVVADELSNMGIPVVARNIGVPYGEIDLVCFDSLRYYVIEEKDYGPRGKAGYFSASEYQRRVSDIEGYLEKFASRVAWIRENPETVGIPRTATIEAVAVMSTNEPHVTPPKGVRLLNVRHLCGVFGGEPVDPPY